MAFTIPDKAEAESNIQSRLFQEDLEIMVAAVDGLDCVLSGCAVTAQVSPDMTVAVAKGAVLSNGTLLPVTAGNVTVTAADPTNPRIDLIVVNSSGTKACRAGTAAASPKPPARTANDVVIAQVYVPAAATTITTARITDRRLTRTRGPILIAKSTTAAATNTLATIFTILTQTIPSGLFLAGKILRCRIYGTYLSNSGAPTWTFTISYGGTAMYADATAATTADTDRKAWWIEFDLIAQGNSDQQLQGIIYFQAPGTTTAPSSGIAGDLATVADVSNPIAGSAAVDSDAADRTLLVQGTMSVSNAAVETRVEGYTLELIG